MNYPKYAEMKDSGVEWIGNIPNKWQLKRRFSTGSSELIVL